MISVDQRERAVDNAARDMTRDAFDAASSVYDETYEHLAGIRHIRNVMQALYLRTFRPGDSLLELNCGTGIDAIALAQRGMRVVATDLSPGMIAETQEKIELHRLGHLVRAEVRSYLELDGLDGPGFDGAYSNLGGLNCTNRLADVARGLSRVLRPGASFIAAVMSDFCLWETGAGLLRGDWNKAFRRHHPEGCLAHLHGGRVRTFYFSPRQFTREFSPWFEPVEVSALNVLIPPPNSIAAYRALGRSFPLFERLDRAVANLPPFRGMGDHFAIVLRRR